MVLEIYYPREAAKLIGIGSATIYRWLKQGKITPMATNHHTLFSRTEVERLAKHLCINCYHYQDDGCSCRELEDIENGCLDWLLR